MNNVFIVIFETPAVGAVLRITLLKLKRPKLCSTPTHSMKLHQFNLRIRNKNTFSDVCTFET